MNRFLFRSIVLIICLGLVGPSGALTSAAPKKKRSSARKSSSARSRGKSIARGRTRTRRARVRRRASAPRPVRKSFDEMIGTSGSATRIPIAETGEAPDLIEEHLLRAHVRFLADDLLEGRGTGARGGELAAKYIAAQFEALGLEPIGPNRTYFQNVLLVGSRTDPATELKFSNATASEVFKFGDEFVAGTDLEESPVNHASDLVFVGYGIQAPELNWDDYKGLDVRGKVLLILVNDPPATAAEPNLFGGRALTYYGRWTYKFEEAARRGASGAILIHTDASAGYGWTVVRGSWSGERFSLAPEASAPPMRLKGWLTEGAARRVAQLGGTDLDRLRQQAESRDFRPVELKTRIETSLRNATRRVSAPNVVAQLRGSDPQLLGEYVFYTAHWDHLGIRPNQPGDHIYNGAVDNATGIAGMLAIARAFTVQQPKRSIVFLATTAEEQGLLGAEHYVRHPLVPLARTIADINLDSMNVLGLASDITPLGAERSTLGKTVEAIAAENNVTVTRDARPEQGSFYRSDHFPFAKAGVPAVSFNPGTKFVGHSEQWAAEQFKEYNETRYHQPSDEYSPNWDLRGIAQQSRLAFLLGLRLANAPDTPQWNPGDEFERARLQSLGKK